MMRASDFVSALSALSFADAFNPYSDRCEVHDKHDAPHRRSKALCAMLEAASSCEIDSLWVGRDLGYRGGRRTGLALTDDVHIGVHASRWGVDIYRPTKGQVVSERTAKMIWSILDLIDVPIFLWNVFPLHPHEAGQPFSNRAHNVRERTAGEDILFELIQRLKPKRIIAIGNDATKSVKKISPNKTTVQVRHPSYGGQTEFLAQMKGVYRYRNVTLL